MQTNDTIAALATGTGGAIAVVRISGAEAIAICDKIFVPVSGIPLASQKGYTLHYGKIINDGAVLDDVLVSLFRAPNSYTGEEMVEISCHGSTYIKNRLLRLLIDSGARSAQAGEFTIRAFLAGKMDLSQAEAVADIIASGSRASHALASTQMRGGYSLELSALRDRLIELVSLLELELDFGEEDVAFADRTQLLDTLGLISAKIDSLLESFSLGNAIKEGVAVAIVGSPNAGKSTLLNMLLGDDRAMVSDIAGTTRDVIEESVNMDGINFRFIDTAGIRSTDDTLEKMGIERTFASLGKARIVLLVVDSSDEPDPEKIKEQIGSLNLAEDQHLAVVLNKTDLRPTPFSAEELASLERTFGCRMLPLSAKSGDRDALLASFLSKTINTDPLYNGDSVVSNSRHYDELLQAKDALQRARTAMQDNIPAELLGQDIRQAIHHIGTITGEITTDEILGSIFSKFCVGK